MTIFYFLKIKVTVANNQSNIDGKRNICNISVALRGLLMIFQDLQGIRDIMRFCWGAPGIAAITITGKTEQSLQKT